MNVHSATIKDTAEDEATEEEVDMELAEEDDHSSVVEEAAMEQAGIRATAIIGEIGRDSSSKKAMDYGATSARNMATRFKTAPSIRRNNKNIATGKTLRPIQLFRRKKK